MNRRRRLGVGRVTIQPVVGRRTRAARLRRGARSARRRRRRRVQPLLVDRPARSAPRPRTIYYMAKSRGPPHARARPADPRFGSSRCGAASPTARRCARCGRSSATGRARALRRGHAAALGRPGRGAAGRGDGRAPGGRARRPGRGPRLAELAARQLAPGLDRLGRADDLDGLSEARRGATARPGARSSGDPPALGSGSSSCTRSAWPAAPGRAACMREGAPRRGRRERRPSSPGPSRSSASRNVGKSTLVNRLTRRGARSCTRRPASRATARSSLCEWYGTWFRLVDTGGVDVADAAPITPQVADQARAAVEEADLVLFVVDARAG